MAGRRKISLLALCVALGTVGCGAGLNAASNNSFAIEASSDHTTTAGKIQFAAHAFNGKPAQVLWTSSGGDDESGPGTVDANGTYTPPAYLRSAAAHVTITATLASDATQTASQAITITPAVSISPQNIAMTPGAQTRLYASIAQVGSGSVAWGSNAAGTAIGTFSAQHCQVSPDTFTQCSVVYTAPVNGEAATVTIQASLKSATKSEASAAPQASIATARLLFNAAATASPLENQAAQSGADVLGTSGGNAHDTANQYCCGGTLGALINIGGEPYVLSNNHVLARTDQANPGESVLQPGLLDTDCGYAPSYTVASLSYFPRLEDPATNVDVAIAQAGSGALDPSGSILGFGPATNGTLANAAPARDAEDITQPGAHLPTVVKSGRTTGLTCGAVSQIAVDFRVDYNTSCDGSGEQFNKTFTNQIAVRGGAFADSGDSGALLADAATAQPVGLLFAGNSAETFANPIADVLHSLASFAAERNPNEPAVAIVGGDHHPVICLQYDDAPTANTAPTSVATAQMVAAQESVTQLRSQLLATMAGLLDVAVGTSMDATSAPAIVLFVDASHPPTTVPQQMEGLRTQIVVTTAAELAQGHPAAARPSADLATLPRQAVDAAIAIKQRFSAALRSDPAIFGVGVGKSLDNPNEAVLAIFIDRNQTPRPIPATLGGLRTQLLLQDPPRAFDWKHNATGAEHHASCGLHSGPNPGLNFGPESSWHALRISGLQ